MTQIVYDLDGVLIRTREANRQAYLSLGVDPPPGFDRVPWQDWLHRHDGGLCTPAKKLHDAKNAALAKFLPDYGEPLPLLELARAQSATVLSNCSDAALRLYEETFPLRELNIHNEMDAADKVAWLLRQDRPGVYVDDSLLTCQRVSQITDWQTLHAGDFT